MKLFKNEESQKKYYDVYDKALSQLSFAYETSYVETRYGNTHIIRCGKKDGKILIMLHSMGFSSIAWFENLKELSNEFNIYCIDSIGEPGRTISYSNKIPFNDYMGWLNQIFDKLNFEQVNLIGWSFGGFLATGYAIYKPEGVNKLAVLSPAATVSPITFSFFLKLFPALFSGKDTKINDFIKWLTGQDKTDYPSYMFTIMAEGLKSFRGWATGNTLRVFSKEELKRITADYYLIIGEKDPIYKKGKHKEIINKINAISSNFKAELIDGTHGFPIQKAKDVNQKMIQFFK